MQYSIIQSVPSEFSVRQYVDFQNGIAATHRQVPYSTTDATIKSMLREKFTDRQRQFVVSDENENWIGHVVARVSPTLRDANDAPQGMLGFFGAVNDQAAIIDLLHDASQWLREQGCQEIVGPIDGDTWHSYRLNTGPYDEPLFLSEPGNPEYYPSLWTAAGFELVDRYHSKVIDDIQAVVPLIKPAFERATEQGYRFRYLNADRFEEELDVIYDLSIAVFHDNYLYDEISRDEFKSLYRRVSFLVDPRLVWFASDPEGQEIGFLFCIVDYAPAIAVMKGQQNAWAKLKFMFRRKFSNAVNFKSIGVIPEHRRSSVAAALMYQGYVESLAKGFRRANLCLIRDGNPSTKLDGGASRLLRRYELYRSA